MRIIILFITGMLLPVLPGYAQQKHSIKQLTGLVLSAETGKPLVGTTIILKKSEASAITNKMGYFSIDLFLQTDTLTIRQVGYHTRHILVSQKIDSLLVIRLKESAAHLQEVVISTGYQQIPKERATGSFTFINRETLNKQVGANILDRLIGVTSGVIAPHKSGAPSLMVRGVSTINGPKDPLIVVDNFPYEGNISNINPDDIESITILKDAAAASIWGTRAGNGVIVITTRKAGFNKPLQVNFNAGVIINQKPDLFYLPKMSSSDYIDVEEYLFSKGFYDNILTGNQRKAVSPVVDILDKENRGLLSTEESKAEIDKLRKQDVRNDYTEYFYQPSVLQRYSLDFEGGNNKMSYLLFGGYDRQINELSAVHNRINISLKNKLCPIKNLQINIRAGYTHTIDISGKPDYNSIKINKREVPYLSFKDEQGNENPLSVDYRKSYTDTAGGGRLLDWNFYPLEDYKHNTTRSKGNDLLASLGINYKIANGLNISMMYQYEKQNSIADNIADVKSYKARNLINSFTYIDPTTGIISYPVPMGGILSTSELTMESQNIRGQANFDHIWGRHRVVAILGAEVRQNSSSGNINTIYGFNENTLNMTGIDLQNSYPDFITGYNSHIPYDNSLSGNLNRFVSYYANAAYTFDNRYTVSISGRKDASNLFGLNTNEKWEPFWSTGLSWNLSNEPFYRSGILPYLKIRGTYGFSGNVDQNMSAVTTIIHTENSNTNLPAAQVSQFANPDLRWETVNTFNLGIDFSFKHQAVSGSVDYYFKKGSNLFGPAPLDYTTGLNRSVLIKNVADMKGNGIDLMLKVKNINRNFKWETNFLFNYYLSKTTKFYRSTKRASTLVKDGDGISAIEGKPLYAIVSYKWGGLNPINGDPQGYVDGKLSSDYRDIVASQSGLEGLVYGGPSLPPVSGSLMNTFHWKGVGLSINILYKMGYYFRKSSIYYSSLFNYGINHSDFSNRWQKPGDELNTDVPSLVYPLPNSRDAFYNRSEATVRNASQIRLQFVNLSYDLEISRFKRIPLNNLQLYINGSNLGILWRANHDHVDPDYIESIPPGKQIAIGIKCSF